MLQYVAYIAEQLRSLFGFAVGIDEEREPMKYIARRFLTLLAAVVAGALLGGLGGGGLLGGWGGGRRVGGGGRVGWLGGGVFMGGWEEGMIFGGMGGAILGMLYDPCTATYTVPTR